MELKLSLFIFVYYGRKDSKKQRLRQKMPQSLFFIAGYLIPGASVSQICFRI